jgi:hypothetical protein
MTTQEKRRQRRAHRITARELVRGGTFLNPTAPIGSIPWVAAQWHLGQARRLGR